MGIQRDLSQRADKFYSVLGMRVSDPTCGGETRGFFLILGGAKRAVYKGFRRIEISGVERAKENIKRRILFRVCSSANLDQVMSVL